MNSKAIRKQLLAAVAMVLVAAVALGSSTYAWFANNNKVTATGIKVNAQTDNSLVISGTSDNGAFTSVGTSTLEVTDLHPATSFDGVNFAKLKSDVKVENAGNYAATNYSASSLETATKDGKFFTDTTYKIKNIGADTNVYVEAVTFTSESALLPSLRISVSDGTTTLVFAPGGASATNVGKTTDSGTTWTLDAPSYVTANTEAAKITALTANVAKELTVRVWYEGQDAACYTDHVDAAKTASVTVVFTSVKPTAGAQG